MARGERWDMAGYPRRPPYPSFGLACRRRSSVGCCDRGGLFRCHHASRRAIKIDANGTFDMRVVSTEIFFEERGDGNGTAEAKSREGHA
jgi:hypothetical protein